MMSSADGKWRMPCAMDDVSDKGAKLSVKGSADNVTLKEFILLLSANGKAHRHCEVSWVKGSEIGVRFVKPDRRKHNTPARKGDTSSAESPAADDAPLVEV
jgi:hypothetical protein